MKALLQRLLGRREPASSESNRASFEMPPLVLREGTTLPIVAWDALDAHAPQGGDPKVLDAFWTAVAHTWLDTLKQALGAGYNIFESQRFLLFGSLEVWPAKVMLDAANGANHSARTHALPVAASADPGLA